VASLSEHSGNYNQSGSNNQSEYWVHELNLVVIFVVTIVEYRQTNLTSCYSCNYIPLMRNDYKSATNETVISSKEMGYFTQHSECLEMKNTKTS